MFTSSRGIINENTDGVLPVTSGFVKDERMHRFPSTVPAQIETIETQTSVITQETALKVPYYAKSIGLQSLLV